MGTERRCWRCCRRTWHFLRAVNTVQTDTFSAVVVQHFDRCHRRDGHDLAGEIGKGCRGCQEQSEQQFIRCIINRIRSEDSAARHNTKRVLPRTRTPP